MDKNKLEDIVNVTVPLCILPYREEAPPIDLVMNNGEFILQVEKVIRKGMFGLGKKG